MPLEAGSILHNRYRIEGQLGKGGMGAVYLAHDQTLGIKVAVKENLNLNPESERQFKREASLLATLRHPNLPRVTDHFVLEGRQYLVMDYIEGVDLHARAAREEVSLEEVLEWASAVADALHYLHTRTPPIIHRDVKPANIKLQPDGEVVLVDFGIAKIFDQEQTTTGARGMTPGYSPPEQYGSGRTDPRSDQFSLAATIYSLLTGHPPADSIERMLNNEQFRPAKEINPAIPDSIDSAITRALSIGQADRYPTMGHFREALTAAPDEVSEITIQPAATTAVHAPPDLPGTQPETQRRGLLPWLAGAGVVGVLLVGGGIALAMVSGGFLSGGPRSTDTPPPPSPTTVIAALASDTPQPTEPEPSETASPEPSATFVPTRPAPLLGGGGRIAFVSNREDGRTLQVWTMNPDGSDPAQLTFGPGNKFWPSWSPDGRQILFVADGGEDRFGNDLGLDVWVMNADGTSLKNITHSPGDDTEPDWSPDGTQIVFASDRVNDVQQVFTLESSCFSLAEEDSCWSVNPVRISCTSEFCAVEFSPAWSPLGNTIAVAASINAAPGRIYLRDPLGGDPEQYDRRDRIIGASDLAWGPGGRLLAFTWQIAGGRNEIYLASLDDRSSDPIQLTNTLGNKEPALSPDGQWIVFTSTRDQDPEIYLMTVNGANEENLTKLPGSRDQQPDWQPLP